MDARRNVWNQHIRRIIEYMAAGVVAAAVTFTGAVHAASSGNGSAYGLDTTISLLLSSPVSLLKQGEVTGSATLPNDFDENRSLANVGLSAGILSVSTGLLTTSSKSNLKQNSVESVAQVDGLGVNAVALLQLDVQAVTATAKASCVNGVVVTEGSTQLAGITGNLLGLTTNPAPNTTLLNLLGLVDVRLNTQTLTTHGIRVNALDLNIRIPLVLTATVSVGEAYAQIADCNPVVTINKPIPNITDATNQAAYTVSGTCSAGSGNISLSFPGASPATSSASCTAGGTWAGSFNTTGLPQGTFTVTASQTASSSTSTDTASANKSTTPPDTTAPVVQITSAPTINLANQANYVVSGTCTVGDGNVTVQIPAGVPSPVIGPCSAAGTFSVSTNATAVAQGMVTILALQTDAAGNTGSDSKQVLKDSIAPAAPTCTAAPNPAAATATVTITCNGVETGATLTIVNAVCTPTPATASNQVICTGQAGAIGSNPPYTVRDPAGNMGTGIVPLTVLGAPAAPICTANPTSGNETTVVTITCTNIASGNTLTIPQTSCVPTPSTGSNVICTGTPTVSNPIATVRDPANQTSSATVIYTFIPTPPPAQIGITKTSSTGSVLVGQAFTYTLTVSNTGASATTAAAIVHDQLPSVVSATAVSGGSCTGLSQSGALLRCVTNGPIAAGATASLVITVIANDSGSFINYAASHPTGVGDPPTPPGPSCDPVSTTCTSAPPVTADPPATARIRLSKQVDSRAVVVGLAFDYTITVSNVGGAATAGSVVFHDALPSVVQATAVSGASCTNLNIEGATLVCTVSGSLAAGASKTVVITVVGSSAVAITNYVASHPTGTGNPPTPPGATCNPTTTICESSPEVSLRNLLPSTGGLFNVSCNSVEQQFDRVAAGATYADYWNGSAASSGAHYVTDLLLEGAGQRFIVTLPNEPIYKEFAGTTQIYAALSCFPTVSSDEAPDYILPNGGVVPKMRRGAAAAEMLAGSKATESASEKWPTIVLSHGAKTSPLDVDTLKLVARLSAEGYFVIAPFLGDKRFADVALDDATASTPLTPEQQERAVTAQAIRIHALQTIMDQLLEDPFYGEFLDHDQITGFGIGTGAAALLTSQGARMVVNTSGDKAGLPYDDRFRAQVSYSPTLGQQNSGLFGDNNAGLARVRVPHLAIGGDKDPAAPLAQIRAGVEAQLGSRYLVRIAEMDKAPRSEDLNDVYNWSLSFLKAHLSRDQLDREAFATIRSIPGGAGGELAFGHTLGWGARDELEVWEYFAPETQKYFMTGSNADKDFLAQYPEIWRTTGNRFATFRTDAPPGSPMWRFWAKDDSTGVNTHFYSTNPADWAMLRQQPWAVDEGEVMRASAPGAQGCPADTETITRYYNPVLVNHRYVIGNNAPALEAPWVNEGAVYCGARYGN